MSTKTKFRIPPKSKFRGLRMDPEIVELIIELNQAGFITYSSCAGHPSYSGKGMMRGYISFEGYNDKEGIMKILEAYGLRNIRIEYGLWDSDNYRGKVTIKYIGSANELNLENYQSKSGFEKLSDWLRAAKGSPYLYEVRMI